VIVEYDIIMTGDEMAAKQGGTTAVERLKNQGLNSYTLDPESIKLGKS
jgi:hypothetical protein